MLQQNVASNCTGYFISLCSSDVLFPRLPNLLHWAQHHLKRSPESASALPSTLSIWNLSWDSVSMGLTGSPLITAGANEVAAWGYTKRLVCDMTADWTTFTYKLAGYCSNLSPFIQLWARNLNGLSSSAIPGIPQMSEETHWEGGFWLIRNSHSWVNKIHGNFMVLPYVYFSKVITGGDLFWGKFPFRWHTTGSFHEGEL